MIQPAAGKNPTESAYLIVKNEQEFYSYIEDRLMDGGFELLETSQGMVWPQSLSTPAC